MPTSESFTQLVTLTAGALLSDDIIPIVDIHDTTQGPTGSTKKITVAALFNAPSVTGNLTVGGTLTVTGVTTLSANALVSGVVKSGKSGSGTGGNFRAIDDTGTERWLMGVSGAAGAKTFIIFDIPNAANRLTINETTGLITMPNGVAITGNSSVTGTLSVTALAGTLQTAAQPNITSVGTLTGLTLSGAISGTSLALTGAITGVTTLATSGGISVMNLTTSAGATIGTTLGVGGAPVAGALSTFIQGTNSVGVRIQRAQSDGDVVLQWSDNVSNSAMMTMAAGQNNLTLNRGLTISTVGLTVAAGGITVTGNSTVTGTLSGITTLTATTLAGTLSTAAQPNITGVGTLTALNLSGLFNYTNAAAQLSGGSTSFSVRNNANSADNLLLTDAGVAIFRNTVAATHYIGNSGTPSGVAGTAAGGAGASSVSVVGSDAGATLTVTTASSGASGVVFIAVTFAVPFAHAPVVLAQWSNIGGSSLGKVTAGSITTTGFNINVDAIPPTNDPLSVSYLAIGY